MMSEEFDDLRRLRSFYFIAFSMRSGSNLLCGYLTSCGLGQPTEYFQWPYEQRMKWLYEELGLSGGDFSDYLEELFRQRSPNGVFGAKVTWDQKNVLLYEAQKRFNGIRTLGDLFPGHRWIYLRRRDKIAQAISLWRAVKSNEWNREGRAGEQLQPDYDYFRLLHCLFGILTEDYLWTDYFSSNEIEPQIVWYENLAHDANEAVRSIIRNVPCPDGSFIDRSVAPLNEREAYVQQRDDYSLLIRERFAADIQRIGVSDHWKSRAAQNKRWEDFFYKELWHDGD